MVTDSEKQDKRENCQVDKHRGIFLFPWCCGRTGEHDDFAGEGCGVLIDWPACHGICRQERWSGLRDSWKGIGTKSCLCRRPDCLYYSGMTRTCDFFLETGERRGCPGDTGCVRYKRRIDLRRRRPALPDVQDWKFPNQKGGN